jgi:hypothetical protein
MVRECITYGEEEMCIRGFGGETEGRRPLGKPRRRWEDKIKIDFQEVPWGLDWTDMAQYRNRCVVFVNAVMNFGFHKMWGNS